MFTPNNEEPAALLSCTPKMEEINPRNWTESVEDLVNDGETDKAISVLESIILKLEQNHKFLELSTALLDLSKLYSSKGFSLKAHAALSRALLIKQTNGESSEQVPGDHVSHDENSSCLKISNKGVHDISKELRNEASTDEGPSDDDWEAVADRDPEELLSPQVLLGISELSIEEPGEPGGKSSKRRGRGTFSYKAQGLYSDQQSDGPIYDDPEESSVSNASDENTQIRNLGHGTRHVLVLDGFPPSTKTIDLEKLVADFKDHGVIIRWISDTVALAVFKSPSLALEASKSMKCPFTVRILEENDELLSSIPPKDLEPPRPRPKTSARTAQRLIAQSMGIKLPSTFGSSELRKQEEARKNRIVSRQHMRDDAWGDN
ncbi:hypothetical protein LIER_09052 [Lithospermum erythrorhizon]|uniref:Coiled-coil domain-containing protein R3HCC1L n=1 Tax=Lithospermum erythrorhizon TaxID=34254 RepID=A0AAV3PE60_LITER